MTKKTKKNQYNPDPVRKSGAHDHASGGVPTSRTPSNDRALTRDEINALPLRRYEGPISMVQSSSDLKRAVRKLKSEWLLGFDTETRPAFEKGKSYQPSLIQLAASDEVFLFHLGHFPLNDGLLSILENPGIIKAGVATARDLSELRQLHPFEARNVVNLEDKARALGFKNQGLRGMAAAILGFRISKQAQTSNWSRKQLTPAQITYAATDAWVSRELYAALDRLERENPIGTDRPCPAP